MKLKIKREKSDWRISMIHRSPCLMIDNFKIFYLLSLQNIFDEGAEDCTD
jgi:hypothetical protein